MAAKYRRLNPKADRDDRAARKRQSSSRWCQDEQCSGSFRVASCRQPAPVRLALGEDCLLHVLLMTDPKSARPDSFAQSADPQKDTNIPVPPGPFYFLEEHLPRLAQ